MTDYTVLADEMMSIIDGNTRCLQESQISATMRGEMAVMRLLGVSEDGAAMAAGEISRRLGMTTSRIAAVLNSLEKKRLILRTSDVDDRRRVMVSLTDMGGAFCKKKQALARAHMTRFLEELGDTDARELVRLIRRVTQVLSSPEFSERQRKDDIVIDGTLKDEILKDEILY